MPDADDTEVTTEPGIAEVDPASEDGDTFPRSAVEALRRESAGYRDRAKTAETRSDELSRELFTARVAALGKLADPTDLEYSEDLLTDPETLAAAVDELIAKRPHYAARRIAAANVGQGNRSDNVSTAPTFADLLRT